MFSPFVLIIMCRCNYQYQNSCSLCNYHHHIKSCRKFLHYHQLVILHSTKNYHDRSFIFFHELLISTHSFPPWKWEALLLLPRHKFVRPQCFYKLQEIQKYSVGVSNVTMFIRKSVKICQLIRMLKHHKHCHPKRLLASFSRHCIHITTVALIKQ